MGWTFSCKVWCSNNSTSGQHFWSKSTEQGKKEGLFTLNTKSINIHSRELLAPSLTLVSTLDYFWLHFQLEVLLWDLFWRPRSLLSCLCLLDTAALLIMPAPQAEATTGAFTHRGESRSPTWRTAHWTHSRVSPSTPQTVWPEGW